MSGPLSGLKVVEMAGLGACPFTAMLLADMGAEVIRIDRPGGGEIMGGLEPRFDVLARSRRSIILDLKQPGARDTVLKLVTQADILLEAYRPGVMERLGLGPQDCFAVNPALIYGRLTGWGQDGPLAHAAGHDINYIALVGALNAIGKPDEAPVPPSNFVGDFGGGGMLLAFGVMCALFEAQRSGLGQVVDAAMTDGTALLTAMTMGLKAAGQWENQRGSNSNDGGAHYYNAYECADGKFISIASAERKFYALLREIAGLNDPIFNLQNDRSHWPELKTRLAEVFRTKTRAEWCSIMEGTDVCFSPVLDWDEAPTHPHNLQRKVYCEMDGVVQPSPAPRFSRTPPATPRPVSAPGEHTESVLTDWGFAKDEISQLMSENICI